MKSFLQTINYASSNEDSGSEIRALRIQDADTVLCITGSGARPLDLLTASPGKIVSIDINPCQNFLLELKMAAIKNLNYQEYMQFLGVRRIKGRCDLYRRIRGSLGKQALEFWDSHPSIIRKGVLYQGRWEWYFRKLSQCVGFIRPRLRRYLFQCTTIPVQATIWMKKWDNWLWQTFMKTISTRCVWEYAFGDPGFFQHVPDSFPVHRYLEERFSSAFSHQLVRESPFARLLFFGRYDDENMLPIYLQKEAYKNIRNNLPRIQIVTQSLADYLDGCSAHQFQKFSLSDVSSYTSPEEYRRIWKGILRSAAPGAVICERQFLVKRDLPIEVQSKIVRNRRLERELEKKDNSIFYTFIIGKLKRINNGFC